MYAASALPASSGVSLDSGPESVMDFDSNAFRTRATALLSESCMAMGAPDGGQELVTRRVSSNAGRPPRNSEMHHSRRPLSAACAIKRASSDRTAVRAHSSSWSGVMADSVGGG